jgi:hypothetical protein
MGSESFDIMNKVAALLYEQYVTQFLGRDLNDLERGTIKALAPPLA